MGISGFINASYNRYPPFGGRGFCVDIWGVVS